MLIHASCAARDDQGVLLLGAAGSGKSDLLLRLIGIGFELVADDQVEINDHQSQPPAPLAGLLEVRGLGIFQLPYRAPVRLALAIQMGRADRLPDPARHANGLPLIMIDPAGPSAPARVRLALDCVLGRRTAIAGALAPC